jgi:glycosyltransferase involved in cell wall biosynthesis
LVTLGAGSFADNIDGVNVESLGYVDHERTKILAYNAADVFVHPARVDNLPNVVMEAIACGTPVIGLPVGGVPEMVRHGQTGWLADKATSASLAETIDCALEDLAKGVSLRGGCRAVAEADYAVERQASRYIGLFASLMNGASVSARALGLHPMHMES